MAAATLMVLRPVFNADFWLVRRTGQWIAEHLAIPMRDPFSFTAGDNLWIEHKWFFDLVVYLVDRLFGVGGLVWMKVGLTLALFGLLLCQAKTAAGRAATVMLFLLTVAALEGRFSLRAHLAGYICLAGSHLLLERNRLGDRRTLGTLAAVQALWANIHGSFVLGPLLLIGWWVGGVLNHRLSKDAPPAPNHRQHAIALALLLAASCCNPYGPALLLTPLEHVFGSFSIAYELAEWRALGSRHLGPWFVALLVACGVAAVPFVVGVIRRAPLLHHLCILLGVGLLASRSARFALPFLVVFIPTAIDRLAPMLAGLPKGPARRALGLTAALLIGAMATPSVRRLATAAETPFRVAVPGMPELSADFLSAQKLEGNVFNSFDFGDYLAGRLHPEIRIFINGRMDLYDPAVHEAYWRAFTHAAEFAESAAIKEVDIVLLNQVTGGGPKVLRNLIDSGQWACVFMGRVAAVLVRRADSDHRSLIARREYRALRPTLDLDYLRPVATDPALASVALAEAKRLQDEAPTSPQGWLAEARLHQLNPDPTARAQACSTYEAALDRFADDAQIRLFLATCVGARGEHKRAAHLARRASFEPSVRRQALLQLGLSLANLGHTAEAETTWTSLLAEHPDDLAARQALAALRATSGAPP